MAIYNLGNLSSSVVSYDDFSVTPFESTDTFQFDIVGNRNISLFLHDISAGDDADLYLYQDTNNNGILDFNDLLVAQSTRAGNSSDVIDYSATTGTYFAVVSRFAAGSNGSVLYDLDLSATYEAGLLSAIPLSYTNYSLTATDPTDVFELRVNGTRTVDLLLSNISAGDDADLRLYQDVNGNGIFDASDRAAGLVASSLNSGAQNDAISYLATSGTYFAEVSRFAGGSTGSVSYDLTLAATPLGQPSNVLIPEVQVGSLSGDRLLNGQVSSTDTVDTYAFSLGFNEGVNILLYGVEWGADVDIRLIRDANNNGIVDASEVVGISQNSGNAPDMIAGVDLSGNYLLQVYQSSGSSNYSVMLDHYATPFA